MAIGSKRPYSRSLLEPIEGTKRSVGVPGPQQFDLLGEGVVGEACPEGLEVRDHGAEVGSSDEPTGSASDVAHHVFRVSDCRNSPRIESTC